MPVPFRPAVFACTMRYMHGAKPKSVWPSPYPAWPELADPSRFYTLPTLASHPAITDCSCRPRWCDQWWAHWDSADCYTDRDLIYVMFPNYAEEILARLPNTTQDIFTMVLDLLETESISVQCFSSGLARYLAAMGSADPEWNTFAYFHEIGHCISLETTRPTIREVNRIASGSSDSLKN
jgi:hypothetical protein